MIYTFVYFSMKVYNEYTFVSKYTFNLLAELI